VWQSHDNRTFTDRRQPAGITALGATSFVAKISDDNQPSLAMFQGKLGYVLHCKEPDFEETHVEFIVTDHSIERLREACPSFKVVPFLHPTAATAAMSTPAATTDETP
jgi:hypothetical protein